MTIIRPDIQERLRREAAAHPCPLLFAGISGAHLYGFPSEDSDYDLRGVHILPLPEVVGLNPPRATIEVSQQKEGLELDLVTHDVRKFMTLLLRRNGYVLEQLYSPLIVYTSAEHEELKEIARGCITRNHSHHYLGFARSQWELLGREDPWRVKSLLYLYRVLLTGIHLMRTGVIEANLLHLNEEFRLGYLADLITAKREGKEKEGLKLIDSAFHTAEYERLTTLLEHEAEQSRLPDAPTARTALNDLLIRIRIQSSRQ